MFDKLLNAYSTIMWFVIAPIFCLLVSISTVWLFSDFFANVVQFYTSAGPKTGYILTTSGSWYNQCIVFVEERTILSDIYHVNKSCSGMVNLDSLKGWEDRLTAPESYGFIKKLFEGIGLIIVCMITGMMVGGPVSLVVGFIANGCYIGTRDNPDGSANNFVKWGGMTAAIIMGAAILIGLGGAFLNIQSNPNFTTVAGRHMTVYHGDVKKDGTLRATPIGMKKWTTEGHIRTSVPENINNMRKLN